MAEGEIRQWQKGAMTQVAQVTEERGNRFNDVIADPAGRVFCGTMSTSARSARLYRLDPDRRITMLFDGVGTSNGIGFSPDRKTVYYTDTKPRTIYRFDYDEATGDIRNGGIFVTVPDREGEGKPDGLTVDSEGCIWSARWGGHCVVRYGPDGREIDRCEVPVARVSSVAFGGPDLDDLFITTAGGDNREENGELAGSVFHMKTSVRGVPEFRSRITS